MDSSACDRGLWSVDEETTSRQDQRGALLQSQWGLFTQGASAQWSYDGPTVGCTDVLDAFTGGGGVRSNGASGSSQIITISSVASFALRGPACNIRGAFTIIFDVAGMRAEAVASGGAAASNVSISVGGGVHFEGVVDSAAAANKFSWPLRLPTIAVNFAPSSAAVFDPDALPVDLAVGGSGGITWNLRDYTLGGPLSAGVPQSWSLVTLHRSHHIPRGSRIAITDATASIERCNITADLAAPFSFIVSVLRMPAASPLSLLGRTNLLISNVRLSLLETQFTNIEVKLLLLSGYSASPLTLRDDAVLTIDGGSTVEAVGCNSTSAMYLALIAFDKYSPLTLFNTSQLTVQNNSRVSADRISATYVFLLLIHLNFRSTLTLHDASALSIDSGAQAMVTDSPAIDTALYLSLLYSENTDPMAFHGSSRLAVSSAFVTATGSGRNNAVCYPNLVYTSNPVDLHDRSQIALTNTTVSLVNGNSSSIRSSGYVLLICSETDSPLTLRNMSRLTVQHSAVRAHNSTLGNLYLSLLYGGTSSPLTLIGGSAVEINDNLVEAAQSRGSAGLYLSLLYATSDSALTLADNASLTVLRSATRAVGTVGDTGLSLSFIFSDNISPLTMVDASVVLVRDSVVEAVEGSGGVNMDMSLLHTPLTLFSTALLVIDNNTVSTNSARSGGTTTTTLMQCLIFFFGGTTYNFYNWSQLLVINNTVLLGEFNTPDADRYRTAYLTAVYCISPWTLHDAAKVLLSGTRLTTTNPVSSIVSGGGWRRYLSLLYSTTNSPLRIAGASSLMMRANTVTALAFGNGIVFTSLIICVTSPFTVSHTAHLDLTANTITVGNIRGSAYIALINTNFGSPLTLVDNSSIVFDDNSVTSSDSDSSGVTQLALILCNGLWRQHNASRVSVRRSHAAVRNTAAVGGSLYVSLIFAAGTGGPSSLDGSSTLLVRDCSATVSDGLSMSAVVGGVVFRVALLALAGEAHIDLDGLTVRADATYVVSSLQLVVFGTQNIVAVAVTLAMRDNASVLITRSTAAITARSTLPLYNASSGQAPFATVLNFPTMSLANRSTVRVCACAASIIDSTVGGTLYSGPARIAGAVENVVGTVAAEDGCNTTSSSTTAAPSPSSNASLPMCGRFVTNTLRYCFRDPTRTATASVSSSATRTATATTTASWTRTALITPTADHTASVGPTPTQNRPPSPVPEPLKPVVVTTQTVTGAVGSVGVVSTVAAVISTSGAILRMAHCANDDDDDDDDTLSPLVHPLRFAVGGGETGQWRYLRGAIIGNTILIPAGTALVFGFVLPLVLLLLVRRRRRLAFGRHRLLLTQRLRQQQSGAGNNRAAPSQHTMDARPQQGEVEDTAPLLSVWQLAALVALPRRQAAAITTSSGQDTSALFDEEASEAAADATHQRRWAHAMLEELRREMGWPSVLVLPPVALAEGTAMAVTRLFATAADGGNAEEEGAAAAVVPALVGLAALTVIVVLWTRALLVVVPARDVRLEPASTIGALVRRTYRKVRARRWRHAAAAAEDTDNINMDTNAASTATAASGTESGAATAGAGGVVEQAWPWVLLVPAFEFRVQPLPADDSDDDRGGPVLAVPLLEESEGVSMRRKMRNTGSSAPTTPVNAPAAILSTRDRRRADREARHDHIIGGKALRWAELGGYVCALGVGMAEGLPPLSQGMCTARVSLAFVLIVVQGLLGVTTVVPVENVFLVALSTASMVTACAALMNVVGAASTDRALLQHSASVVGGLGLVAIAAALMRPVITVRRMLRAADAMIQAEISAVPAEGGTPATPAITMPPSSLQPPPPTTGAAISDVDLEEDGVLSNIDVDDSSSGHAASELGKMAAPAPQPPPPAVPQREEHRHEPLPHPHRQQHGSAIRLPPLGNDRSLADAAPHRDWGSVTTVGIIEELEAEEQQRRRQRKKGNGDADKKNNNSRGVTWESDDVGGRLLDIQTLLDRHPSPRSLI